LDCKKSDVVGAFERLEAITRIEVSAKHREVGRRLADGTIRIAKTELRHPPLLTPPPVAPQ
jgi:hypothetical protein